MATNCCASSAVHTSKRYRRALWVAFGLNATMLILEIVMGAKSASLSLLADSLDFFADSANYLMSLVVLPMALAYRAKVAWFKGLVMAVSGVLILLMACVRAWTGVLPNYEQMGVIGLLALFANGLSLWVLYHFREGDSNMRSVWLCSRNDAIGNVAVMVAGGLVALTGTNYPDLVVAVILATLALTTAHTIIKQARLELNTNICQS